MGSLLEYAQPFFRTKFISFTLQLLRDSIQFLIRASPQADPLLLSVLHEILHTGASCQGTSLSNRSTTVYIGSKPLRVPSKKMIEAAVLLAVESLFDHSHCYRGVNSGDISCTLLDAYDGILTAPEDQQDSDKPEVSQGTTDDSFNGKCTQ